MVEHSAADDCNESHLRRQAHADPMGFEKAFANSLKRREAHAHMDAEWKTAPDELIPDRRKARIREQTFSRSSENARCDSAEPLHFLDGFYSLGRISQRQQTCPFETFRICCTVFAHIAIVGPVQCRFETGVGGEPRIPRRWKK